MSRPLCWSFSVVQLLELYSAYFGRYSINLLSFTTLQMYHWHLHMIYYKLDILLQMVSYEVMTIENEMGSCKVLTIANNNEMYKTHIFVILFIHYSSFCILCLNVLYHFTYNYRSYYTKAFSIMIFIYSLCFYLYILQCNSGFDLHIYIPLYLFTVHLLYNHCILIRYSYYIVVTYVHIVVSYYFFFYIWSWIDHYQFS